MRHNTISYALENGVISPLQALMLTDCLYASIVFDGCCQIKLEDYNTETDFALSLLAESLNIPKFTFEKFYIPELDNIKTDNKDIWRIYALTSSYSFLGKETK